MSISGLFLVIFLLFHMVMNLAAVFSTRAYDMICEYLGANWYALVGTLILALGFLVHIVYAFWLTLQSRRARGTQRYAVTDQPGVSWASRNMLVLGIIVLLGLLLHLYNFWYRMQWAEIVGDPHAIIQGSVLLEELFANPLYCIVYLVWFAAIWFHLTHGFWSAFQTVGWTNKIWLARLQRLSYVFATLIFVGFAAVVVWFYVLSLCQGACA